jgi:hypothetical protein
MSIKFLTAQQASDQYRSTTYFNQMNYTELVYRIHSLGSSYSSTESIPVLRSKIRKMYTNLTLDFDESEKDIIRFYFRHLFNLLRKKAPALIPNKAPIGLIKLAPNVDWNYPYTIEHCLVLPAIFIDTLVNNYQQFIDQMNQQTNTIWNPTRPLYDKIDQKNNILCHELIHILQRNVKLYPGHKTLFDYIYKNIWGFQPITKSQIKFRHINEDQIFNVLTNPDGYNFEWIIPVFNHDTNREHLFAPLLSRNLDNKPIGILVELDEESNPDGPSSYVVSKHWNYIDQIKRYQNKFYGLEKQLYHPNEISAHLISGYIVLDTVHTDTQDTFEYYKFYQFINRYFVSMNFTPFRDR